MDDDGGLLTIPQAASRLGVSRWWLYSQARAGRVHVVQLGAQDAGNRGKMLRLSERDLDALTPVASTEER